MNAEPPIHPNYLTAMRLPLAPIAVICMVFQNPVGYVAAAILSLALEITDLADGWVARRYGRVSDFGKLFDPFSDAFCRYTLFLGLYAIDVADLWMIMVLFYRDSSISFLRTIAANRNVIISARRSGKIKAIVQGVGTQIIFLALVVHVFFPDLPFVVHVPWWTMLVITIVTAGSFLDYFSGNFPLLRDAWSNRPVK